MVFANLFFLFFFLPICLLCYFLAKKISTRNTILIVFSLIFYAWGEPLYVFLLVFSAFLNWIVGLGIERFRDEGRKPKLILAGGIIIDIIILLIFKYTAFFATNINSIFGGNLTVPDIALPIGISFFTFQAISYIIDVYWEEVSAQSSFKNFLLYLSLFPQLIAGPIVRYSTIEGEILNRRSTSNDVSQGLLRVMCGLAKKVIIANNLYTIVDTFYADGIQDLSFLGTWYVVIVYALYVYFDFSGYSDMAIGLGRIFGFHFDENFRYPFACQTIAEFWQRWHISLGSFFRDYLLYVPIAGRNFKYLNLFLVWFCTGMWHGASWNFIIWGLYFGFFIFFEQKLGKKRLKKWKLWQKHLYSKLVIVIGFGIFYFEDFGQLGYFFRNIFGIGMIEGRTPFADTLTWSSFVNNIILFAFAVVLSLPVFPKIKSFFLENKNPTIYKLGRYGALIGCVILLIVSSILLVDTTNNPFLYFRF